MSRSWSGDGDSAEYPLALWENSLVKALNGKRGQAFLKELEQELLGMQARGEGRLLTGYLVADGSPLKSHYWTEGEASQFPKQLAPVGCCTLGVMLKKKVPEAELKRWVNREVDDPYEGTQFIKNLNVASCMIAEIGTQNDSAGGYSALKETDEQRFERMLRWVQKHISKAGELVAR